MSHTEQQYRTRIYSKNQPMKEDVRIVLVVFCVVIGITVLWYLLGLALACAERTNQRERTWNRMQDTLIMHTVQLSDIEQKLREMEYMPTADAVAAAHGNT